MRKLKIFISSVQKEFAEERQSLFEYLYSDPLLGLFFEPFLFENIWNPGILPLGLSTAKLRKPHRSIPANPLLAEPMYLAGYIERMGTGTGDIIRLCNEAGLKEPEFIQEEDFKTIIWRTLKITGQDGEVSGEVLEADVAVNDDVIGGVTLQATPQATLQADEISEAIKRVVLVLYGDLKRAEIQEILGLKDRVNFVANYLEPSLGSAYIEMTIPEIPTHQEQRYRLTDKGITLKAKLQKSKKKK